MGLRILNVSYSMAAVRPDSAGGAEQVLWQIDRALTQRGHSSVVVALEGSLVSGELVSTPVLEGFLDRSSQRQEYRHHRMAIESVLARGEIDVIHMHGIDFHEYLPGGSDIPILVTLHLPPSWYPPSAFDLPRRNLFYHGVSFTQQKEIPDTGDQWLPVISNGVQVEDFAVATERGGHVVALGRICPEKGFHLALDAAKLAGTPMVLAGQTFPYSSHLHYFEKEIAPRLDEERRFIGPVGLEEKRELLAGAESVLIPSLCPETSSLVAMEALAAGTPVIAFPSGALPEIVEHGRTGFIVQSVQEMADAIRWTRDLDREECRRVARKRFSADRMIEKYLSTYRLLSAQNRNRNPETSFYGRES